MLEFVVYSLFIGSLGLEALLTSNWLYRRQLLLAKQNQVEEEEVLKEYESNRAQQPQPQVNGSAKKAPYTAPQTGDWEYKIVRASSDLFRDPKVFRKLCREEEYAGWVLLEKLDNQRVRFQRSRASRQPIAPGPRPIDPYRCHYGPSMKLPQWVGSIAIAACIIIPAYVGYSIMLGIIESRRQPSIPSGDTPQSLPEAPPTVEGSPQSDSSLVTGADGRSGSVSPSLH
ncbi:MAG: hypothetical protein GDA56_25535 [Hormoscilla sp. GM7CHS1pb]|nr:hypothetical protein [Hormoscilla sp. GM7CHS1pb]